MKTNIKFILGILLVLASFNVQAQKAPKTLTKTFDTSANCGMCKERIEGKLNYTKGIVFAELDIPTKKLTVKWKTKNMTEEQVKEIVSNIGYDIDDVSANLENQELLPTCCKPGGHDH